jgi:cytochrome c-type biogenesis protein CcmE
MKKQAKFGIGIGIIVVSMAGLAWLGYGESKTYYHTLAELDGLKGSQRNQHMRIGGAVQAGSIHRMTGRVDFVLEGEGKALPVSYVGSDPLPDTFVDKSQALIEGKPTPEGRFVADHVQAKCASKYEEAPGGGKTTPDSTPKTAPTGTTQRTSM